MLNIIAHRGWWKKPEEKNTKDAFIAALEHGFGIETDFRDYAGEIVISHDIPGKGCMSSADFFSMCAALYPAGTIAVNVKADGLQTKLAYELKKYSVQDYFVFDASVPDLLGYIRNDMTVFSRRSEFEPESTLDEKAAGIWLDQFNNNAFEQHMYDQLPRAKEICIVSPELHKREHLFYWQSLKGYLHKKGDFKRVSLCTDFPDKAKEFFK